MRELRYVNFYNAFPIQLLIRLRLVDPFRFSWYSCWLLYCETQTHNVHKWEPLTLHCREKVNKIHLQHTDHQAPHCASCWHHFISLFLGRRGLLGTKFIQIAQTQSVSTSSEGVNIHHKLPKQPKWPHPFQSPEYLFYKWYYLQSKTLRIIPYGDGNLMTDTQTNMQ